VKHVLIRAGNQNENRFYRSSVGRAEPDIDTQCVTTLTFRTTRGQLRGLAIFTAVLSGLAIALAAIVGASRGWLGSGAGPWFIGCALAAMIGGYCLVVYALTFTECTPEALRTRSPIGRLHVLPWPQVADITVRAVSARGQTTYTVVVTPVAGKRFRLGAPVSGGVMSDPQFAAKVQQIQEYWRTATGSAGASSATVSAGASTAGPGPHVAAHAAARGIHIDARPLTAARVTRRITQVVFLILPLIVIGVSMGDIGPAWAAHLGHGERGIFTAYASNCSQRPCAWFGTFTSFDGVNVNGLQLAAGGDVSHIGQVVPAINVGAGNGEVYPGNGGTDWIYASLIMAAGVVVLCADLFFLTRSLRRRTALRRTLIS
jgi:hypothetical protein